MGCALGIAVVSVLTGLVVAQERAAAPEPPPQAKPALRVRPLARVFDCRSLAPYGEVDRAALLVKLIDSLNRILVPAIGGGSDVARIDELSWVNLLSLDEKRSLMLGRGSEWQLKAVQLALDELAKEELLRARLECSLIVLPAAVAVGHGLEPNVVTATDEHGSIKLVREAVEHDGTLRNLPPCVVAPLVPFVVGPAGKPAATDDQGLQLRGEMVPMAPGEIAVTMHLVRAAEAAAPLLPLCFRLKAGKSAMVMRVDAGVATVLLVRCTEMTNGPVPPPTGK